MEVLVLKLEEERCRKPSILTQIKKVKAIDLIRPVKQTLESCFNEGAVEIEKLCKEA